MSRLDPLLTLLDTAYNKTSWHGPNLRGSFPLEGSNFFERPLEATAASYHAGQIQRLKKLHSRRRAGR